MIRNIFFWMVRHMSKHGSRRKKQNFIVTSQNTHFLLCSDMHVLRVQGNIWNADGTYTIKLRRNSHRIHKTLKAWEVITVTRRQNSSAGTVTILKAGRQINLGSLFGMNKRADQVWGPPSLLFNRYSADFYSDRVMKSTAHLKLCWS